MGVENELTDDDLKREICKAFGVTWEEVATFDKAIGGPQERAARAHFQDVEMPHRIRWALKAIRAALPPDLRVTYGEDGP